MTKEITKLRGFEEKKRGVTNIKGKEDDVQTTSKEGSYNMLISPCMVNFLMSTWNLANSIFKIITNFLNNLAVKTNFTPNTSLHNILYISDGLWKM
jgi:hypothetical protein